jgi:branched-chain amino acid transport system substrate-binding protein
LHKFWRLAIFAVIGAVLSWCAAARAEAPTEPIKLGILNDQSGPFRDLGGPWSVEAARMAAEDFGGSVLGRKVEIVFADHQNKADIGAGIARRWFDNENVTALMDVMVSSVALAVQELARERHKIVMYSGAASSDLTGKLCSPTSVQWTWDSYAVDATLTKPIIRSGGDTWFFIAVDYAFGEALQRDATAMIVPLGGKVVGSIRHPVGNQDFASFLLQAQASKAKVIALADAGQDMSNAVKQAAEFGIVDAGQKLVGLSANISDVHSMGLQLAHGLLLAEPFYWDMNDASRTWSKRFLARTGRMPNLTMAGVYGSTLGYLKAVQTAGTTDSDAVMATLKKTRINDFMTKDGWIREDGRMMRDFYLFEVKKPSESTGPWDYYRLVQTVPAEEAARPLSESVCPLVKHAAEKPK